MKLIELIGEYQKAKAGDERFQTFDPVNCDYTAMVKYPDGRNATLRNPKEEDGKLIDKGHEVPEGTVLVALGTAFWDWRNKIHKEIGIDVDSVQGHAAGVGIEDEELKNALDSAMKLKWIEIRRSSGGKGVHLFGKFAEGVSIKKRKDATALGKGVVERMCRETGYDFAAARDCVGSNLWIYKSDAPDNAYEILKPATETLSESDLPAGWRESKRLSQQKVGFASSEIELDETHIQIEKQIAETGASIYYNSDFGSYHVHTAGLQMAAEKHGYKGLFKTLSSGSDLGKPNAFMIPLNNGAFLVKRWGNAKEDSSWLDGPSGQCTFLNAFMPFEKALQHFSLNSTTKGLAFTSTGLKEFLAATGFEFVYPEELSDRQVFVRLKEGVAKLTVDRKDEDHIIDGWTRVNNTWQASFKAPNNSGARREAELIFAFEKVRAAASKSMSDLWYLNTSGEWIQTTSSEVDRVLTSLGMAAKKTMGEMRLDPYHIVSEPFQAEYMPGKRWNLNAAQLAQQPADEAGPTPTWDAIFQHIGSGLDEAVSECPECTGAGILDGAHYLKLWVKLLFEKPSQSLPYLLLTSRENVTGKSSFGFAISKMISPGVVEISAEAITDKYTSELEGTVCALVEELDLRGKDNKAYSNIKRMVTSHSLQIRKMRTNTYTATNYARFIHTTNDARFVPCESEDVRIVMIDVPQILVPIEPMAFEAGIEEEVPSILRKLIDMPLPESCGRLYLPVVQTALKEQVLAGEYANFATPAEEGLKAFAKDCLEKATAKHIPVKETLVRYGDYCLSNNFPVVPRSAFLKTLKEKCNLKVSRKQFRKGKGRSWHYTGISYKSQANL
ncbi:DUF5906 domain-containing protein [Adhaeretor mobilis]|uniref:NrS-1 polymerase-like helicase domain-containing protein n=1 Tax=Adhaeretor mobilis TaxID=1930276 RepID=A0A517MVZ5_9BACT|nr:DUF5906 domain-containing protein [Adhaeretor mobilis]QDS99051.1 hypothetical protein HG15A2_23410 [Adhaeretor mobilis]